MAGTASRARIWIAVEHPGPWPAHAVADILGDIAVPEGMRIVLIRQSRSTEGRVFISDPESGRLHAANVNHAGEIAQWDLIAISNGHLPGRRTTAHPILVCTNGRRDQCCAIAGRELLRECAQASVWESTHLGGHRFSPVVLRLSDGFMFGRVTPHDLSHILAGRTPVHCARGRTAYPPAVQAAEIAVLNAGRQVTGVTPLAADPRTVHVDTSDGPLTVAVQQTTTPFRRPESCGGKEESLTVWECFVKGVD